MTRLHLPAVSRRRLLTLAGAGALAVTGVATAPMVYATTNKGTPDPFTLGVASGEPRPDSVVLWTRLAPDPLAPGSGLPASVKVDWELAKDERMTRIVRRGTAIATAGLGHSVHIEPTGLEPGRDYWYRFRAGAHLSVTGRTKTLPHPAARPARFDLAVASCQNFVTGYYTAHRFLAEDHPDLVLFLGDYIYEITDGGGGGGGGGFQPVRTLQRTAIPTDLDGYRVRYGEYKRDQNLRAAHAAAPFVCVWDDHDVKNDYAGLVPQPSNVPNFAALRAAAYQACYENLPMRRRAGTDFANLRIYHRFSIGRLATFHMLDTRQYRDDQPCDDGTKYGNLKVDDSCTQRHDPARTILGSAQRNWLLDGLTRSRTRWNLLGQQVLFSALDQNEDPNKGEWEVDSWDGYTADRQRVVDRLRDARVSNPVILTGDLHSHLVSDVKPSFTDPSAPTVATVATELVTTGISSPSLPDVQAGTGNPHIRFASHHNGYQTIRLGNDELRMDVYSMRNPGGGRLVMPDSTREKEASYVVEAGKAGAERA